MIYAENISDSSGMITSSLIDQYVSNNSNIQSSNRQEIADFTLLLYMVGSNLEDESYEATKDINELTKANSSNSKINVLIETGGSKGKPDATRFIDFSSIKRHILVNNSLITLPFSSNSSMGEQKTLAEFINWGISQFPSKKYGLIMWDHGGGYGGFGNDINFNTNKGDTLTLHELENALHDVTMVQKGNLSAFKTQFEFIGFDSCLMASIEVVKSIYEGTNDAIVNNQIDLNYLIASEEVEPPWGWNYTVLLNKISNNPEITGVDLGRYLSLSYANDTKLLSEERNIFTEMDITLSVINMKKVEDLLNRMEYLTNNLTGILKDKDSISKLINIVDKTEHFGRTSTESFGLVDFYHLMENIRDEFPTLYSKATFIMDEIKEIVSYNYKGDLRPNSNGISIYFPVTKTEYDNAILNEGTTLNLSWLKLMMDLSRIHKSDFTAASVQSERNGSEINIRSNDFIREISYDTIFNSKDAPVAYSQQYLLQGPLVNFTYHHGKILGLCNEKSCIPVTTLSQANDELVRIFVPVLIVSEEGIETRTSLIFVYKNNSFYFLGGINDDTIRKSINGAKELNSITAGKERTNLNAGDIIYTQGLNPLRFSLNESEPLYDQLKDRKHVFKKNYWLNVMDPADINLKLIEPNSSSLQFILCNYSSVCNKTKVYDFNRTDIFISYHNISDPSQFIFKEDSSKDHKNSYTYVNREYDFQVTYPNTWIPITTYTNPNYTAFSFSDLEVMILFSLEGINENAPFPSNTISVFVQDSTSSNDLQRIYEHFSFMFERSNPKMSFNAVGNGNSYSYFDIVVTSPFAATYWIKGMEINNRIYILYSSLENATNHNLSTVKEIYNSFKPYDHHHDKHSKESEMKSIEDENQLKMIEQNRSMYIFQNISWKQYHDDVNNITAKFPSFLNDTYNPNFKNGSNFFRSAYILPFLDIHPGQISFVSFDTANSGVLEKISALATLPGYTELLKLFNILDTDVKKVLFLMERYGDPAPGREVSEWSFIRLSHHDLVGLISESTYYSTFYSANVIEKTLSFIKNNEYIKIRLTAPNNYGLYEYFFDNIISSLKLY
ncbi:MAG: clostripain-related cysteine peptidase [Candidatus Nitrosocosmicus sp.]